ncbi:MAG TPA: FliI/YscN family ATPase [Nitrospiraceae bacterium]|nr:FliI/YscN family ATPase [Nitrospiraceae bacterium]
MKPSELIERLDPVAVHGRLAQAAGIVIEGYGAVTSIGELCEVTREDGGTSLMAEVVGFRGDRVLLMPLGDIRGVGPGSRLVIKGRPASVSVGPALLGRVLDGLGEPLDGLGSIQTETHYPLYRTPMNPLQRRSITEPLDVGVRAINGLLTCGRGQKIGIFAGSGVGKSILLGMISRNTVADVSVIALIGERGREVNEFLERDLRPDGLKRSVVIVATSDQPPLVRIRAAFLATAIAEYFRDCGQHVLLLMDSLTRFAHGQREVGLAIGEPPTTKGYTPSVLALLPKLLERVGTSAGRGTLTGLYTILVEGDDLSDPIADSARSILDGHIVLSRDLVARGHFPAIDILQSTSRVMRRIVTPAHQSAARTVVDLLSAYTRAEDLISLGAYKPGSNDRLDRAVKTIDDINCYLKQEVDEPGGLEISIEALIKLAERAR